MIINPLFTLEFPLYTYRLFLPSGYWLWGSLVVDLLIFFKINIVWFERPTTHLPEALRGGIWLATFLWLELFNISPLLPEFFLLQYIIFITRIFFGWTFSIYHLYYRKLPTSDHWGVIFNFFFHQVCKNFLPSVQLWNLETEMIFGGTAGTSGRVNILSSA